MKKQIILLPATLLLALGAVQGQDVKERLKAHVYTLASDEFAGRKPNTHGDTLAANYIREQLKAMPALNCWPKTACRNSLTRHTATWPPKAIRSKRANVL